MSWVYTGVGDTHAFENPWLLSLNLLFYRYHNKVADYTMKYHPDWTSDQVFEHSRRWVIATMQVGVSRVCVCVCVCVRACVRE